MASTEALFTTTLETKLTLDSVYCNGIHVLHRFEITNKIASSLLIKPRSNLASQISFQLSNENIRSLSRDSTFSFQDDFPETRQFNQIFNQMGYIDQVIIPPFSSRQVIILFLPKLKDSNSVFVGDEQDHTFDFFEVNGQLFFFGYKLIDNEDSQINAIDSTDSPIGSTVSPDYQVILKLILDYSEIQI